MVHSLLHAAFRAGGFISVAVVHCRRSSSGVALAFTFRGHLGVSRFWRVAGRVRGACVGPSLSVLVPVAGALPFGPPLVFPVAGLRSLAPLSLRVGVALL